MLFTKPPLKGYIKQEKGYKPYTRKRKGSQLPIPNIPNPNISSYITKS